MLGEALDEAGLGLGGEGRHNISQVFQGFGSHFCDLSPAVADVDDDGAASGVENSAAIGRDEVRALSAVDGKRLGRRARHEGGPTRGVGVDGHRTTGYSPRVIIRQLA